MFPRLLPFILLLPLAAPAIGASPDFARDILPARESFCLDCHDDSRKPKGNLMVTAFQNDLTRVATLLVDPEHWDSPRMYHGIFDTPQNHHVITHAQGGEARAKLAQTASVKRERFADSTGTPREILT